MPRKSNPGPPNSEFLEDPNVREWFNTRYLESERTAYGYLGAMCRVWRLLDVDPTGFAQGDQLDLDRRGQRVLTELQHYRQPSGEPLSFSYLRHVKYAMMAWLDWNGREFKRAPRIGRAPKKPKASKQFVPVPRQLRMVLDVAGPRDRASISLEAFAGLRPEVQGSTDGDRGLMLENVSGLVQGDDRWFSVETLPLRIEVSDELSKTGRGFFSYLGAEGADYVVAYLNARVAQGEPLRLGSRQPLIAHLKGAGRPSSKPFVRTDSLCDAMRNVHKKAGLELPPYIWRSYFDTHMMLAESKGAVIRDYREFWMGHTGDIEADYTVRKQLPPSVLQNMAERYMASMKYLETRHEADRDDARLTVALAMLYGIGCSEEEVAALDLDNPNGATIQVLVQEKVKALKSAEAGPRQQLVAVDEVRAWLERGWTWAYAAPVPDGLALMEAPTESYAEGAVASFSESRDAPVAA